MNFRLDHNSYYIILPNCFKVEKDGKWTDIIQGNANHSSKCLQGILEAIEQ